MPPGKYRINELYAQSLKKQANSVAVHERQGCH